MEKRIQKIIWLTAILIMSFGLATLYSATFENVRVSHDIFWDQLFCSLIGLIIILVLSRIDYIRFYDVAYVFYGINVLILIFVLLMGRHALGATRWFQLGGISFQPSEFMKFSLILALARYYTSRSSSELFGYYNKSQMFLRYFIVPGFMALVPMALIFKQPDLGTAILLFCIFMSILFVSGVRYRYFAGLLGGCIALIPFGWLFLKEYQKSRLLVFLNPNIDPLGAGYTITQSKIAIGSGRWLGKGWFGGTQNQLNFLPERHTDFIFGVIGEEWGLIGSIILLSLFFILIHNAFIIAEKTKDRFGMYISVGIIAIITTQVIINIGMVMGLFPIVGITLPLVSYGRSSFLITAVMIGILLNLNRKQAVFR